MAHRTYNTKQKAFLQGCLASHSDRYLTVRELCGLLEAEGQRVGHTTAYRNLEDMVARGVVLKFTGFGGEARYCIAPTRSCGQLVCLDCGRVQMLECGRLGALTEHVRDDHGFDVELSKTVLYGHCASCKR